MIYGELLGDNVIIRDEKDGNRLYNSGHYGTPLSGGGLSLPLIEALYLVEKKILTVFKNEKVLDIEKLVRVGVLLYPNFEIKYIVYRDLRQRGYTLKPLDGLDFRIYERGGIPIKSPSKYWALAISERSMFNLERITEILKKVKNVRKEFIICVVDEESDLTYYRVRKVNPRGSMQSTIRTDKPITAYLLEDRVLILDNTDAKKLHENEFYGKLFGEGLQLSLIEAAYLLEKGILTIKNAKTSRKISYERFKKLCKKIQQDFELRLKVFRNLKERRIIVKTGFKYGAHFRGYKKDPDSVHARYLVHAVPSNYVAPWPEISRAVRLAHGVKKDILFGVIAQTQDKIEYIELERIKL